MVMREVELGVLLRRIFEDTKASRPATALNNGPPQAVCWLDKNAFSNSDDMLVMDCVFEMLYVRRAIGS